MVLQILMALKGNAQTQQPHIDAGITASVDGDALHFIRARCEVGDAEAISDVREKGEACTRQVEFEAQAGACAHGEVLQVFFER